MALIDNEKRYYRVHQMNLKISDNSVTVQVQGLASKEKRLEIEAGTYDRKWEKEVYEPVSAIISAEDAAAITKIMYKYVQADKKFESFESDEK
jgi:hypothetical protein